MTTLLSRAARWHSPGKAFLLSLLLSAVAVLAYAGWQRYTDMQALERIDARRVTTFIDVTTQLHPVDLAAVARRYVAVVDLRPDGEAAGQPSSREMAVAARQSGLPFSYIPVPHGEIPQEAVERLRAVLDQGNGAVLLYCRSGKRAARTWALAEASRPDGLSVAEILAAVQGVGQDAGDLEGRIQLAVKARRREAP